MPEEKLYELLKDITCPGHYYRAGERRTAEAWQKEFGFIDIEWEKEWFLDLSKKHNPLLRDNLSHLIETVFTRKQLRSYSYKEAAREVAELWLKQNHETTKRS